MMISQLQRIKKIVGSSSNSRNITTTTSTSLGTTTTTSRTLFSRSGTSSSILHLPAIRSSTYYIGLNYASRRFVSSLSSSSSSSSSSSLLWLGQYNNRYNKSRYQQQYNKRIISTFERYQNNVSKLYVRHVLAVLAAAAAAAAAYQIQQEQNKKSSHNKKKLDDQMSKPSNWDDWERREWSKELYHSLGRTSLERLYSATKRIIQLSLLVSPYVVMYPLSFVSNRVHDWSWQYALFAIEHAGPTYIKLVQWATTRQDLFTPHFCHYFGKLRDNTVGHSWNDTVNIIQKELHINVRQNTIGQQQQQQQQQQTNNNNKNDDIENEENTLLQLNPIPIGSGCVAQVYYGTLLRDVTAHYHSGTDTNVNTTTATRRKQQQTIESEASSSSSNTILSTTPSTGNTSGGTPITYKAGTEIAVKVQHPNIYHKVCCDFYILGTIAQLLEQIPYLNLKYLSLNDTVNQFRDIMLPQLDLSIEAKHLQHFINDFQNDKHVEFPQPIYATDKVLMETFVHGQPIMNYITSTESERKELALLGLRTTLKMIFDHDFLHGDLHPGNLLVSGTSGNFKLHLLDCGLVVEMGPAQHVNLVKILGAFVKKNGRLAGQLMVDTASTQSSNGEVPRSSPVDVDFFVKGIEQIVLDDQNNNFIEKVGDYITDICYLACQRKVKLEAAFINAALAVEIMEGIATALDPTLVVTQTALPMVLAAEMMHGLQDLKLW